MILVTTGTTAPPFDRLLREVEKLARHEPVVVQHGPSRLRPTGATCVDYISFERFVALVETARVVVTHAGVGSILVTIMNGKRPVVVPRLARFGEHVDDHQLELARRLRDLDVVTLVEDPAELEDAIYGESRRNEAIGIERTGRLAEELAAYLDSVLGEERRRPRTVRTGDPQEKPSVLA